MMLKKLLNLCVLLMGMGIIFNLFSCKKDEILTDSSAKLEFSADSVLFDTVFTSVGSTTKQFKIFNRNKQPINISSIKLAKGANSNFRINVDGVSLTSTGNIEIEGNDSLYVFVEVTVDPNNQNSPLMIMDSVVFETNGNIQDVDLIAVGQDVYFHKPDVFPLNGFPPYSIFSCNDVWINDKPHVIYGYAVVDEGCKLTIQEGVKVYLHNSAILWVYKGGTLEVKGTSSNKVTFQGDRLEPEYSNVAGQWGKIWLSAESKDNIIDWALIKNGSIGIQADTLGASINPTLRLSNTIIQNMSAASVFAQGSSINAFNCIFVNSGQYLAALTIGGKYSFKHCTFANYWGASTRTTTSILLNNWYEAANATINIRNLDSAYFGNCIIYGNNEEEITLDSLIGKFDYKFENCLLRTKLATTNSYHYSNIYKNQDPAFVDPFVYNMKINSNSSAIDKGNITIGNMYPFDLDAKARPNPTTSIPDLGAYEFY